MNEKKVTVSIITPFYKGNKYLERLFYCIKENACYCKEDCEIEFILVNDSPQEEVVYEDSWVKGFKFTIVRNKKNVGIHQSRINGLNVAVGEYIIFLDQDDHLSVDAVARRFHAKRDYDVIVSNGVDENPLNYGRIYKSERHQLMALEERYYYIIGNMIVSPGQCMIRKSSIPLEWTENIVKNNGSDDLLLWLLMFRKGYKFGANSDLTYTHEDTGSNVSADFQKMEKSSGEVLSILKETVGVTKKQEIDFIRRFKMRRMYEGKGILKKLTAYLCYPDIAFFIIRTRG